MKAETSSIEKQMKESQKQSEESMKGLGEALDSLSATALQVKAERDLLLKALEYYASHCDGGTGVADRALAQIREGRAL